MSSYECLDNYDGDLTTDVEVLVVSGDLKSPGQHRVNYKLKDSSGNELDYTREITIEKLYEFNEDIIVGDFSIRIQSFRFSTVDSELRTGYYSYYDADEGQVFLICKVKITNNGTSEEEPFDNWNREEEVKSHLTVSNEYEYKVTPHFLDNNWHGFYQSVKSLQSVTYNLTYEMPKKFQYTSEEIILSIYLGDDSDKSYLKVR